jgi:hypothetical protein
MDRELILATLVCVLCGPALWAVAWLPSRLPALASARDLEGRAWRRLWRAILPAAMVLAFLIGWALQEPEAAEPAGPVLLAVAAAVAVVWSRAIMRAVRSARHRPRDVVAMTVGLWRPKVSIAPALAARLDEAALRAALEHEAAHARHRDPLRLWLAQIATDLQWPSRAARRRFADWRNALELARDAEACDHVDGSDLAAALIEAARLSSPSAGPAIAGLVTSADGARAFTDRIHRLLDPQPTTAPARARAWTPWLLVAGAIGAALAAGSLFGEDVVRWLPGLGA